MITVAIVGILSAIALPSYYKYVIDTRLMGDAQFLVESFKLARIEAVTRDVIVSACPSSDGMGCSGNKCEVGWIIFTDEGEDGNQRGFEFSLNPSSAVVNNSIALSQNINNRRSSRMSPSGRFRTFTNVCFRPEADVGAYTKEEPLPLGQAQVQMMFV